MKGIRSSYELGVLNGLIESYKVSPRRFNRASNKAMLEKIMKQAEKIADQSTDEIVRAQARTLLLEFVKYLKSLVRDNTSDAK